MQHYLTKNNKLIRYVCYLVLLWTGITPVHAVSDPLQAVRALIERVTPGYSGQFRLELIPAADDDVYAISGKQGEVTLRGNNAVALSVAYHQYLKQTCKANISWCGDRIDLPRRLPAPQQPVDGRINGKHRVYMNYCTVSYSAPWWDWERWERELDFMAMSGINMPLFTVGLEAVWYNTLLRYGFSDAEARKFLTGPAHSAWQWMQNIQDYGGPLPKSWIDSHAELGRRIIDRMLELDMQPIQQGFSGYVPRELKAKYPQAAIRLQPNWCSFPGAAQLDPTDPLFTEFGRAFLEEEKALFGAHGVYAADPFHESAPPVNTPEYLHAVGSTIHQLFKDFDPSATWAMQGWSLRQDIVKAVPKTDLLILDLNGAHAVKPNACWGYPLVAGNLHNFGGRINMHGDLQLVASNQYAKARRRSPNVCGSGLFMEGITQNPVYYDLAFEMPLHADSMDLNAWLADYAERRYGGRSKKAEKAWQLLLAGPYRPGTNNVEKSSIIAARPALDAKKSGPNDGLGIPYPPRMLWDALTLLLDAPRKFGKSEGYRFDVIDVERQALSNLGQTIHRQAAKAFRNNDSEAFKLHSERFLQMLRDVDELLRTRSEYNFDKWLHDARRHGQTEQEKNLLERDATALLTIWGPEPTPTIFDYGWREWSGLIAGFYLPRWELFYHSLADSLAHGRSYEEQGIPMVYGREAFRANPLYKRMAEGEMAFVNRPNKVRYPLTQGDELKTARRLYKKYRPLAEAYYRDEQEPAAIKKMRTYENLGEKP